MRFDELSLITISRLSRRQIPMRSLLMMAIFNSRLASRLVRAPALRVLLGSRILPSVATRRNDSIFTKYREPPNGFLFNEKVYVKFMI